MTSQFQRAQESFLEYAKFDSALLRSLIGISGLTAATALRAMGRGAKALQVETSLHRNAFSGLVDRVVEARVKRSLVNPSGKLERYIETLQPQRSTESLFKDPTRLLGQRILAVKSPEGREKGVLILDYSFVFSLFVRHFDIERVAEKYHIVLEPSWSGACDRDVLALAGYDFPVFVQNSEPRDIAFQERLGANLVPIPIAANWWVDHRVFRPLPGATRDADVLMNSAWAKFKRHDAFFATLARLRAQGTRLKVLLVGYAVDLTRQDILKLAAGHGVADQIEAFEGLRPPQINELLNRVKVNLLWSRREGFNRAIIEGFSAGVPGVMRLGFNYGYRYPYINAATGAFAAERELPERLREMIAGSSRFTPRAWVEENMTPQIATRIIDETIARHAERRSEPWTRGRLAVKVTSLNSMSYWDEAERERFATDYELLRSLRRPS